MDWSSREPVRVLHVDDDPGFIDVAAAFLEREDDRLTVERASSASEGLDRLTEDVDCVVSDYDMPGTNGIEFLETVRETRPDLPFILFTGKGSEEVASDAISAGVTDYLQKEHGTGQYAVLANRIDNAVDQYRAKTALETSQQRLSLFVEQSPLGVLEYDETFEIVGLNPAGEEILGYTEEELRGHTWEKLVCESSYENVEAVTTALAEAEGGFHSVDENVRKDGERIVCEWHNRVVTDANDDVVAVFSLFQDVTERREHEEDLRRTTARLEALFENSPDMIDIHDADGEIIEVNPQLCDVTGYSEAELVGRKVWEIDELIDPDEARALWEGMAVGERRRLDGVYTCRDGSTVPVEVHIRRLDLNGDDQFVVISRDVSERVEYERQLEETTARYEALVENFPDGGVFMFDDRLEYTLAGGDGLEDAGMSADDFIGRRPDDLFPDGIAEELMDYYRRALAGAEHTFEQQYGGAQYRIRTLPVRNDDGEVVAGMAVSQDVTAQIRRERRLSRQKDRLEEFAGVVSHDLRNPLAVAEGHLDLARTTDNADEHLDTVANAHRRMRVLIDELLTLAREGGTVEPTGSVALANVVETAWRNVETAGATLVVDTDRTVVADRSQLQQLVENLVRNSVEHGSTNPRSEGHGDAVEHGSTNGRTVTADVTVTVTVGDLDGGFYVADDGQGIPTEERARVFESGYSTQADGTGFGLYIVEQMVERHGWSIHVDESDDGGARFDITGVDTA
ncbi:PAS domain S-box protein [Salinigranum sp. GCM10025319]|uniref:PAS domain S-box protein n=1 Tax=Salinigranum sp. GCM10025319 TaxID=3252687 RepID=UPI003609B422